jgi:hypothetical protein
LIHLSLLTIIINIAASTYVVNCKYKLMDLLAHGFITVLGNVPVRCTGRENEAARAKQLILHYVRGIILEKKCVMEANSAK